MSAFTQPDPMRRSGQPNVPGMGTTAGYGARFWGVVVAIGAGAGLAGAALTALLHAVEHISFGFRHGSLLAGVRNSSDARRIIVVLLAGVLVLAGVAWRRRRRERGKDDVIEISSALWREGRLAPWASAVAAVQSIVIVSMGASLGREAAPQLAGATLAGELADRARIDPAQRRLLVACGAGAGMAAVYNVPLGGALFALEVLLGTATLPLVLPALATTLTATAVAWLVVSSRPLYSIPHIAISPSLVICAALIGPLAGLAAVAWVRLVARAHRLHIRGPRAALFGLLAFGGLGALSLAYPQLLGNGQDAVTLAFNARLGLGLLAILLVLKPLVTAACLGSGAPGGLFTPTLAYGALLGGVLGHLWNGLWPGSPGGSFAVIGAAAVLAAAMQGPLSAVVLIVELTGHADSQMVAILLAVAEATMVARLLRAPSIYAAREEPAGARTPALCGSG